MFKALAFGLGVGAAVQAFRNFPPDGPMQADSVAVVFLAGMVAAFFGGISRRSVSATAVAAASAEASASAAATNTVNVAVVIPGRGATSGVTVPGEAGVSWQGERRAVASVDDLDGADLSELLDLHPDSEAVQ